MEIGPQVCGTCLVLLKPDIDTSGPIFVCSVCKQYNKPENSFRLYDLTFENQVYITSRTDLYKNRKLVEYDLKVNATSRRKFPIGADPNAIIRPWLENNIGIQGIDWNWDIDPNNFEYIEYYFANPLHATLFELAW